MPYRGKSAIYNRHPNTTENIRTIRGKNPPYVSGYERTGHSKQAKGFLASYYKRFTKLKLTDIEIDKLTNKRIDDFYKELKLIYPDFDKYPSEVKLALFDLIYNLGMTELKNNWPNFNKHIKAKDWKAAAGESSRKPPISPARNKYVKDLLEKAAKKAAVTKKP